MIQIALKTAFRSLLRFKLNTFIIILSLTLSFTFSYILITFVLRELQTNSFYTKADRTFQLFSTDPFDEGKKIRFIISKAATFIKDHYADIEEVCTISDFNVKSLKNKAKDNRIEDIMVIEGDSTFFRFFGYSLKEGNTNTALHPGNIVLTTSLAEKLLQAPPYLGQIVELELDTTVHLFTVGAVMENPSENSQLKFDGLVLANQLSTQRGGTAFVLLHKNVDPNALMTKINANPKVPSLIGPGGSKYELENIQGTYFNQSNVQPFEKSQNKTIIWICCGVVFLISTAACFNFINLFIIHLVNRTKEIGVKKVLGASAKLLGISLALEIGMYIFISLLFSTLFISQLLPYFNFSFDTTIQLAYLLNLDVIFIMTSLILLLALLISIYLGFFLQRLPAVSLIRSQTSHKIKVNRFMIGAQFFISIGMMLCSVIIISQMHYIQNKELGFNRNLIQINNPNGAKPENLSVLKQELLQSSAINSVSVATGNPISDNMMVRLEIDEQNFYSPYLLSGDLDLVNTLGLNIVEGKAFSHGFTNGKLVNEAFVRHFNLKNPIGETIPGTQDKIIGVVQDFNSVSLRQEIPPYIISFQDHANCILIDIGGQTLSSLLPIVAKSWAEVFPDDTFKYKLIDDELLAKHSEDQLFYLMIISFTGASVLISCFGLFGIGAFTATLRTKEIGVRKVLGASVFNILSLLSKDFVRMTLIAFVLAACVANYFMNEWLQGFAYKVDIAWWMFAVAGILSLFIVLLTVSYQSIKAALANPVDSIRTE